MLIHIFCSPFLKRLLFDKMCDSDASETSCHTTYYDPEFNEIWEDMAQTMKLKEQDEELQKLFANQMDLGAVEKRDK